MVQVGGRGWWWVSRKYHSIGWNLPLCRQRDLQARTNQNRLSFVMPFSFVCVRLHLWFFVKSPNVFDYSTWKRFRLRHDSFPASGFDIRTPSTSPCRNWSSYPNWRQKKRMKTCWHFYFLANLVANSDGQIFRVFEIGAKSFIGFERGPRFRCSIERHLAVNVVTVLCVPISIGAVAPDSNIEIWGFSSDWRQ